MIWILLTIVSMPGLPESSHVGPAFTRQADCEVAALRAVQTAPKRTSVTAWCVAHK